MKTQDTTNEVDKVLSDQQKDAIKLFCSNEVMFDAVKTVLLFPIYNQGVIKKGKKANIDNNWARSGMANNNENLGAWVRAVNAGLDMLEDGFDVLEGYKEFGNTGKVGETENPAR